MKAYVGADWSATEVVCSLGIGDEPVRRIKGAARTFSAVQALLRQVRARNAEIDEVHVVIEAGAPGWVELFHHAGAIVHVADPKQAKAYAASVCSSGAKDDGRDADQLVGMGRSPAHLPRVWKPHDEQRSQLQELGGMHETLTHELGAAQQRLRSHLRERFPALEAVLGNLTREWVLRLLRAVPTPWHAARATEMAIQCACAGARSTSHAKVVTAIAETEYSWLTEGRARIEALHVEQLVAHIALLVEQVGVVEAEVDALTRDLDLRKQLESVGGIAQNMAHRLIEFGIGEEASHRDQAGVVLGACPVFQGSGKTSRGKPKGRTAMRRAASSRAKATTYLLGRLAAQQLGWAGRMYVDARGRGQTAPTAYRRIARCLLRILTAMVRSGEAYDDDRYLAALKAKGVPWACDAEAA